MSPQLPVIVSSELTASNPDSKVCTVSLDIEGLEHTLKANLTFVRPFSISHEMYTCGTTKFVQFALENLTQTSFCICNPKLETENSSDVDLQLLNEDIENMVGY